MKATEPVECHDCGQKLEANGYRDGCLTVKCTRDKTRFGIEVEVQRQFLSLAMIDRIAKNEMPHCFAPQRETLVAMASLLMQALRQNEELVNALQMQGAAVKH